MERPIYIYIYIYLINICVCVCVCVGSLFFIGVDTTSSRREKYVFSRRGIVSQDRACTHILISG